MEGGGAQGGRVHVCVWLLAMSSQSGLNVSFPNIVPAPCGHGLRASSHRQVGRLCCPVPTPVVPFPHVLFAPGNLL